MTLGECAWLNNALRVIMPPASQALENLAGYNYDSTP